MIERGVTYLTGAQHADGGWGHQPDEPSDPISTAFGVIGLSHGGGDLRTAIGYLHNEQHDHGGFTSRPDSTGPRPIVYDVPALADLCPLIALGHLARAKTPSAADCAATPPGPVSRHRDRLAQRVACSAGAVDLETSHMRVRSEQDLDRAFLQSSCGIST